MFPYDIVLDSSGKIIDGTFVGHGIALGNIHECTNIETKNFTFNGQYFGDLKFVNMKFRDL